jgi:hypothetical protein
MPVSPAISHAHHLTIGQADPARALNMQEIDLDRIFQPGEFQTTAAQGASLNAGAVVEHLAIAQFGRAAIEGVGVARAAGERAVQLGFIIASEQRGRIADDDGFEEQLKKRLGRGVGCPCIGGKGADRTPVWAGQFVTGFQKTGQSGAVVVILPAF